METYFPSCVDMKHLNKLFWLKKCLKSRKNFPRRMMELSDRSNNKKEWKLNDVKHFYLMRCWCANFCHLWRFLWHKKYLTYQNPIMQYAATVITFVWVKTNNKKVRAWCEANKGEINDTCWFFNRKFRVFLNFKHLNWTKLLQIHQGINSKFLIYSKKSFHSEIEQLNNALNFFIAILFPTSSSSYFVKTNKKFFHTF